MPFIIGQFNIHSLLQQIFLIPTHCNKKTSTFHQNAKFNHPLQKFLWTAVKLFWITYILVSIHSLFQLKQAWRKGGNKNKDMEQFGVTILIVTMVSNGLSVMWIGAKYAQQCGWILTKLAQIQQMPKADWPSLQRLPDLTEVFAYAVTFGYLSFPLFTCSIPVFRDYDSCERIFSVIISYTFPYSVKILSKLITVIVLLVVSLYTAVLGLVYILLIDSVVESFKVILPLTYLGNRTIGLFGYNFNHSFSLFSQLQIVLNVCNQIIYFYLPVLFSVGIISSSWGLYAMIMLVDVIPIVIYVSGILITVLVYALICLLAPVAAFPLEKSKTYKKSGNVDLFLKKIV